MRILQRAIFGKTHGDFNPDQGRYSSGDNFEMFLNGIYRKERVNTMFAPKCSFTNRIAKLGEQDETLQDWLVRTKLAADGGIVEAPEKAVAIFNGDCPVVALFDSNTGRLAVMHAGTRCLIPENPRQKSILRVAFEDHGFDPKTVKVFAGFGIGPCCYGAEHLREVRDPFTGGNVPVGKATRGRRAGKLSLDLYQLILHQLLGCGVCEDNILLDTQCTSCAKESVAGGMDFKYYSNCRGEKGRNLSLVWYAEQPDENTIGSVFGRQFRSPYD